MTASKAVTPSPNAYRELTPREWKTRFADSPMRPLADSRPD